ncbi:hypothetical protein JAAARDRAFT_219567 [Jaapia argillacea MUCL 33604]|uniref:Uncharacterized protein n=1 Tax=Jaapia argillacea MUCL 33604 TaxID=933084 RepID=A0A067QAX7_9AGAM|nr:hypothetical protein JAAARDRAFT_219567 [Jaapia argillacea MUCL 33604]
MATISDPFLLASYDVSQRYKIQNKPGECSSHVFASHHPSPNSGDGWVTTTVQGEGVHVLDLTTLHPAASYSLGPHTFFTCPAVSRSSLEGTTNLLTTYAVIESAPEVSQNESGRTIWKWSEDLASPSAKPDKETFTAPHRISYLLAPQFIQSILLISPTATLSTLSPSLLLQSTSPPTYDGCSLVKSFVFNRSEVEFLSGATLSKAIVVLFIRVDQVLKMSVLGVDDGGGITELGDEEIPIGKPDIVDISCNPAGYLSILSRSGSWDAYTLSPLTPLSTPLKLSPTSLPLSPILSLTSSHTLLTSLSPSSSHLTILIWDLRYGVLLTSHTLSVPATLGKAVKVEVGDAGNGQVVLVLTPLGREKKERSSVLVLPYTCPDTSTIAGVLGKASLGQKYLDVPTTTAGGGGLDINQQKLLEKIQKSLDQKDPSAAASAFFTWSSSPSSSGDGSLGYNFIRSLLLLTLAPSKPNYPYPNGVVKYLVEKGVVRSGMLGVEGELVEALVLRGDWCWLWKTSLTFPNRH